MVKKPRKENVTKEPIRVQFIHRFNKFSGYHSEHFEVVFPDNFVGPDVHEVFAQMTMQFGRNDHVHFKHRQDITGFEIVIDNEATTSTLGIVRGILERIVGRVAERPAILQLLDQMPKNPRFP